MLFTPEALETAWSRILMTERDSAYFVVSTEFNDKNEVIRHTYNQVSIPDMAVRLHIMATIHPEVNFGPLEVFATNKKF